MRFLALFLPLFWLFWLFSGVFGAPFWSFLKLFLETSLSFWSFFWCLFGDSFLSFWRLLSCLFGDSLCVFLALSDFEILLFSFVGPLPSSPPLSSLLSPFCLLLISFLFLFCLPLRLSFVSFLPLSFWVTLSPLGLLFFSLSSLFFLFLSPSLMPFSLLFSSFLSSFFCLFGLCLSCFLSSFLSPFSFLFVSFGRASCLFLIFSSSVISFLSPFKCPFVPVSMPFCLLFISFFLSFLSPFHFPFLLPFDAFLFSFCLLLS